MSTVADLERVLAGVGEQTSIASYLQAARALDGLRESLQGVRAALVSSFTIDALVPYLRVEAARDRLDLDVYVGRFNSVSQELLDPRSGCSTHAPDVVFVCELLEDACPPLSLDFLSLTPTDVDQLIEEVAGRLLAAVSGFRGHSNAAVVVQNFAQPSYALLGIYEPMAERSQTDAIRRLNARLVEMLRPVPGVYVLDVERTVGEIGSRQWFDPKMWSLARAPLSPHALRALARTQLAYVRALLGRTRKCLVLDLDNTLWGGVVGEAGMAGIDIGHTHPGSAFRAFQQYLLQLYRRGVLLAINSKNNAADVEEVLDSHPDMVLRRRHFAAIRANWQPKARNMQELAAELGIGTDALAFFDDSPAECAHMRQALPEVLTMQAPADITRYADVVIQSGAFERLSMTDEDRRRGEMYQSQRQRSALELSSTSVEAFLTSLELAVEIRPADEWSAPRVHELLQKTNQFNVTTRRHSAAQLREFMDDARYGVFSLRLSDRYGDNGIVGAAIVQIDGDRALVDSLLLSCRIIGRGAETALLAHLAEWARAGGAAVLEGEFIATAKNAPAADLFARHGFTKVASDDKSSRWRLHLEEAGVQWPTYIRAVRDTGTSSKRR